MKKILLTLSICIAVFSCRNSSSNNINLGAVILPTFGTFKAVLPAQKEVIMSSLKLDSLLVLSGDSMYVKRANELRELGLVNTNNYDLVSKYADISRYKHYKKMYPNFQIILEHELQKILEKYDLKLTNLYNYTGSIPDESLNSILEFKPLQKYAVLIDNAQDWYSHSFSATDVFIEGEVIDGRPDVKGAMASGGWNTQGDFTANNSFTIPVLLPQGKLRIVPFVKKDNLFIAADESEILKVERKEIQTIANESPDPMVFLKLNNVYVAITCWGSEKSALDK